MGMNERIFPEILNSVTCLGKAEFGIVDSDVNLIAVPGHDTACAALCAAEGRPSPSSN